MAQYLLQKGDQIRLEKGMEVYAKIPDRFRYCNQPFSSISSNFDIKIGEIYRKEAPSKEALIEKIMCSLTYIEVTEEQVTAFVDSLSLNYNSEEFDTSLYAGEYVVDSTSLCGGGTQGTPSGTETFPDGWCVFCSKIDDPSIQVHFYQTGCFTAMIPDILPIAKS